MVPFFADAIQTPFVYLQRSPCINETIKQLFYCSSRCIINEKLLFCFELFLQLQQFDLGRVQQLS